MNGREQIHYIRLVFEVIRLKLFLDVVSSPSTDNVTTLVTEIFLEPLGLST